METENLAGIESLEHKNLSNEVHKKKKSNYNLLATAVSGAIVGSALIVMAYLVGEERSVYPTTYIICICGYILGWIVALISTPMNKTDEDKLGRFTKMAGTFLTGYLLSKFDKILEKILDPAQVFSSIAGARILLFICCFGLTFIMVYYYREYKWSIKESN
jgi:uncharacterized membrane protein YeaQ/YmgE (transglycosylase-associated protein family)